MTTQALEAARRILDYWDSHGRSPRTPHSQDEVVVARALLSSSKAEGEMLKRAKASLDIRLNDHLCEMKEGYDDSIVGFNEAWDVVRAFFDERLAAPRPSQLPLKDTTNE